MNFFFSGMQALGWMGVGYNIHANNKWAIFGFIMFTLVMTEIPVSSSDLDSIVYNVSRDLVEQKAIDGKIDEVTEEISNKILDDVIYTIERYMYYINSLMDDKKLESAKNISIIKQ